MSSLLYLLLKNSSNSHHNYYVLVTVLEERRGPQTLKTGQRMALGSRGGTWRKGREFRRDGWLSGSKDASVKFKRGLNNVALWI